MIQGYTGQIDMWANRVAYEPTFLERLDRFFAFARHDLGAMPSTFTEFRRAYAG